VKLNEFSLRVFFIKRKEPTFDNRDDRPSTHAEMWEVRAEAEAPARVSLFYNEGSLSNLPLMGELLRVKVEDYRTAPAAGATESLEPPPPNKAKFVTSHGEEIEKE